MSEKIQKLLAQAGLGSRRQLEEWLIAGRVSVNGRLAKLGDRAELTDRILVDGHPIKLTPEKGFKRRVLVYHKPEGLVCTRADPEGRPTVFNDLPPIRGQRWIMVGRLDLNTSGLLLFTTDGELANRLMHPSYEIEREYAVRVLGQVEPAMLKRLQQGVELEDGLAKFDAIMDAGGTGANHWYHVLLREGRNREVRRIWESQGVKVSRLIRVRYGIIPLPRMLRPGKWQELPPEQLQELFKLVKLPIHEKASTSPNERPRKKGITRLSSSRKQGRHR